MFRLVIVAAGLALLTVLPAVTAGAAEEPEWPLVHLGGEQHAIDRGLGGYLGGLKILLCWLLFLLWVKTTDWVNRDCQTLRMQYSLWIPVNFFPFVAGLFLFAMSIPWFAVGYILLLACYVAPMTVYVLQRNKRVPPHERVMTRPHVRYLLATTLGKVGIKIDSEKRAAHEKGAPVDFVAKGAEDDARNKANLAAAQQSPGFLPAKHLISEALGRRASKVLLDYTAESVAVRQQIDGVWHDVTPMEREQGDMMLAVFKKMANLNMEERRARQEGKFGAKMEDRTYSVLLASRGTKTGERVLIDLVDPDVRFESLEELGMRDIMREQIADQLQASRGMVLFSSMPSGGLRTMMTLGLRTTDRFMRDFASVEEASARPLDVDNVEIVTFDAAKGQSPADVLPSLIRKEPNAVVARELLDAAMVKILCEQAAKDKLIVSSIRAKSAAEALLRVLMLKVPAAKFAPVAKAVMNARLVRKLCDACKEPYVPSPEILKRLGIPEGRVEHFYRPPTPPEDPKEKYEPCRHCHEIGYRGLTGIYELLLVDDGVRAALVKQPKLETVQKMARKAGNRNLQEEGIMLVARGVTSLTELTRVLKQ